MSNWWRLFGAVLVSASLVTNTARAAEVKRVDVSKSGKRYLVETEVLVAASMPQVFDVLTNFEQLSGLSGAIQESRVQQKITDNEQVVFTKVKGCVLFFCRTVERLERVLAHYPCELSADLVDGYGELESSSSYWRLSPSGAGTRLYFSTEVEPLFWVPGMIGEQVLKGMVMKTLLDSMMAAEQVAAGGG